MKGDANQTHSLIKKRVSLLSIILYLLFAVPVSIFIAGLVALLLVTINNVSNFEGARGYAWIGWLMVIAPLIYIPCLITLPILIKKYPKALSVMNWIFAALSLCLIFSLTLM
ncbi:hypothetical protein [Acinetobacter haemolyticus]|uniref:Uncharacterized protein n=1 Tax=Acinetobacter haemolyticus TaxID=29430 RepID=A0A857IHK4_ACIHA|nr:hypothetical protein F926_01088 [Acinetobacter haemolyticus NIPH 261]QHI11702.1 hypothetical protein AhaeAN59_04230 [Acinetobacter haemolyticus]QHI12634.1 hypothetical protein AhaeAN43_04185 [Acinetobacter haemolyticus]